MPLPDDLLDTPIAGLRATPPERLPYQADVLLRSFVLERTPGNVLVYNSPGLTKAAMQIRDLGPTTHLLINHHHEAMYGQPDLDVEVFVHEHDRAEVARAMPVASVFTGAQTIDDDLQVIPTPGHTAGTTSYLWDNGHYRFLFTGDFIWIDHGEWTAVVLDPSLRTDYLDSLALVRELDFDVLVPWGTTEGTPCFGRTDTASTRTRIDAIAARVEAGGSR